MTKEDQGKAIEDIVEQICSIAFLKDFVVRNPKFRKESGQTKEAADFLVPFKETLIAFQVRSRTELKPASEKAEIDFGRIRKTVLKGVDQLKTIRRAIIAQQIREFRNARNITLPFDPAIIKNIIGIVIFELIGEEKFTKEERTSISGGYVFQHDMPIHIFRLHDFQLLVTEVNTIPDFIEYLDVRQRLFEKHILGPLTEELDFLALYKVNPDMIQQCLDGQCDRLTIVSGIWDDYQKKHRKKIRQRNFLNIPSLVIDDVIEHIHQSIDYDPGVQIPFNRNGFRHGTLDNYIANIAELSTLRRLERRAIGKKFLEKMRKADFKGDGHSIIINPNEKSAILVLATNRARQERMNRMCNLCAVAYCSLKLKKMIGIASEPLSSKVRSYDVIFMQDVEFENCEKLAKRFEECFGPRQDYHFTEYGGDDKESQT